jgi:hypothetical protein
METTEGKSPALTGVQLATGIASALLGQAPWITTVTGYYPLSLYQNPSIYRGYEPFLLAPMMVAVFATWAVILWRSAMWVLFAVFVVLFAFIYWAYVSFPPSSSIHPINWILSYCAFALFIASLARSFHLRSA